MFPAQIGTKRKTMRLQKKKSMLIQKEMERLLRNAIEKSSLPLLL